jgi:acid stress-induced BolA-like protein IbaG/YrbA
MVHFPTLSKEEIKSIIEQALQSARCSQLKTIFVALKRLKKQKQCNAGLISMTNHTIWALYERLKKQGCSIC